MKDRVLIVDDEESILKSLSRMLRGEEFDVLAAAGGEAAIEILKQHEVAAVLSDYRMPGMNGSEFLAHAARLQPDAVRIALTGHADVDIAQKYINDGQISQFFQKPWDDVQLKSAIRNAVKQYDMKREIARLHQITRQQRDRLRDWSTALEDTVRRRTEMLQQTYDDTLNALLAALDCRERPTAGHSRRVALHALYFAIRIGVDEKSLENLYRGALIHDVGKIGIPDAILCKPGPLTPEERVIIEQHVPIGVNLIEGITYLRSALAIPRYHHEKYDGTGYCEGLAGDDIPIEARIFAIIDVYDALTNDRPYKDAIPHEQAIDIIKTGIGSHFDPMISDVFLNTAHATLRTLSEASHSVHQFTDAMEVCTRLSKGRELSQPPGLSPQHHQAASRLERGDPLPEPRGA